MVRLELYVGGRRVSVNDYLRSPGRDFTALNRLHRFGSGRAA